MGYREDNGIWTSVDERKRGGKYGHVPEILSLLTYHKVCRLLFVGANADLAQAIVFRTPYFLDFFF